MAADETGSALRAFACGVPEDFVVRVGVAVGRSLVTACELE